MLVLSRKRSEQIVINGSIRITVVKLDRGTVRLGVEAPSDVSIVRRELLGGFDDAPPSEINEALRAGSSKRDQ